MSYFGLPNPVSVGLQGSLGVALLLLSVVVLFYFPPSRISIPLVSSIFAAFILLTFANWWHYQFFQIYFNYEFLAFARDGGSALRSIAQFAYWPQICLQALIFCLAGVVFYLWRRSVVAAKYVVSHAAIALLAGGLLLHLSAGQIEQLRQANALTLSPYYFHPVQAFFYSLQDDSEKAYNNWLEYKNRNSILEENAYLPVGVDTRSYNIIVLTLESFRASFVGVYSGKSGLTPEFDAMAKRAVLFENFYANSNYTIKSENAITCGFFDHNAKLSIAEYEGEKNLHCLPQILTAAGYQTYYMHANHGKFYNRVRHIRELGFQDIYFHADRFPTRDDGRHYIGWGLADEDFFALALERLQLGLQHEENGESGKSRPFYAHLMSISTHYPFQYDWPIPVPNDLARIDGQQQKIYAGYENAIRYSDHALGSFWRAFRDSPLAENTILVVTGDHGVWSFDPAAEGGDLQRNEEYYRVPLLIYHPQIAAGYHVTQIASHVDIPPTLLELLGIEYAPQQFVGKNMFHRVVEPWAVMMKGGEVSARIGDNICVPQRPDCAGIYQSCWAETGAAEIIEQLGRGQCYRYRGDLLTGGTAEPVPVLEKLLPQTFGMISYENSRVMNPAEMLHKPRPLPVEPEVAGAVGR